MAIQPSINWITEMNWARRIVSPLVSAGLNLKGKCRVIGWLQLLCIRSGIATGDKYRTVSSSIFCVTQVDRDREKLCSDIERWVYEKFDYFLVGNKFSVETYH